MRHRSGKRSSSPDRRGLEFRATEEGSREPAAMKKKARRPRPPGGSGADEEDDEAQEAARRKSAAAIERQIASIASELCFPMAASAAPPEASDKSAPSRGARQAEASEFLGALRSLRQRLETLQAGARNALDRFTPAGVSGRASGSGPASFAEMKVQLLLSYVISLVYYLLLKSQGVPVRDHPVVLRLLWLRSLIEKLRPVDQRLQYQMGKLLQWSADVKAAGSAAAVAAAANDARELRPGTLATGVEGEGDSEADDGEDTDAKAAATSRYGAEEDADDGIYRPPMIAQMEYTGDHVSMQERADRDLERKKRRLGQSEFVRSLREEFTDLPTEHHGELRNDRAEKAMRKLAEKEAYELDHMVRVRHSAAEKKEQRYLLRQTRLGSGGTVSLEDATADFRELSKTSLLGDGGGFGRKGKGKGKGRRREGGGGVLQEFQAASNRAREAHRVVASTLPGGVGGAGSKGGAKGKKRRRGGGDD